MMDFERIIYAPICTIIAVMYSLDIYLDIITKPLPFDSLSFLLIINKMLVMIYYLLVVAFFIVRSRAVAKSKSFWPRGAAYFATFIPFIPSFERNNQITIAPSLFLLFVVIVGTLFTLYSLKTLGRSFSIAPQVRMLVQNGPYRFIRHPLYVGEIITFSGIILAGFSILRLSTFFLMILIQTYRAFQEEKLLEEHIPNYSLYKKATKRFIPGLI